MSGVRWQNVLTFMLDPEEIDASFHAMRVRRVLERSRDRIVDPDFWRELNPEFAITDEPIASGAMPYDVRWLDAALVERRLHADGYFVTPPVVDVAEVTRLRQGIERVVAAGFPAGFAFVYDDVYRLYARFDRLFAPLLGPRPLLLPTDAWVFHVPAGDGVRTHWTTFGPHRDWIGPDPAVLAGESPSVLVGWTALTDVTPIDSCLYVVPADCDPDYRSTTKEVNTAGLRLQDVRALPAPAGALVLMTVHLVHWGSRSSALSTAPRTSLSMFFQRRDVAPFTQPVIDTAFPIPFRSRLTWIYNTMCMMMKPEDVRALAAQLATC
jgi:hypothetical protein